MERYIAYGDDSLTLRLVSKLPDLRVANAKWGRLRALPVADEASKKEWQRSKFGEAKSEQQILGTATGHDGAPRKITYKN